MDRPSAHHGSLVAAAIWLPCPGEHAPHSLRRRGVLLRARGELHGVVGYAESVRSRRHLARAAIFAG
jgi:hypothetical protein